jgi:hypothetical protein
MNPIKKLDEYINLIRVKNAYNLLNQIEKKSSLMLFGLVCQNVFAADCIISDIYVCSCKPLDSNNEILLEVALSTIKQANKHITC